MRKVATLFFEYNVTHKIVAAEADVSQGETIFLEAGFWQKSLRFDLPTEGSDGATASLFVEVKNNLYEVPGKIQDNKIIVTLTPDIIQLGSVLDCWFVWKVEDKVSPRFPLKLRVAYNPLGVEPPQETQPAPVQRFVTVTDQAAGTVTPPSVEARIRNAQDNAALALNAANDAANAASNAQDTANNALEVAERKADAPIVEIENAARNEKYTIHNGVVTKTTTTIIPAGWWVRLDDVEHLIPTGLESGQLRPLPWSNTSPMSYAYSAPFVLDGEEVRVYVQQSNFAQVPRSVRIAIRRVSDSTEVYGKYGVSFTISNTGTWTGQTYTNSNGNVTQIGFRDTPSMETDTTDYPLLTQAQIDALSPKPITAITVPNGGTLTFPDSGAGRMFVVDTPAAFTLDPSNVLVGFAAVPPNSVTHVAVYTWQGINYIQTGYSRAK